MADNSTQPDPFVDLSLQTSAGLSNAIRELGWIADGGDPSASLDDRDLARLQKIEYERERIRVAQRLTAYLAKQLSVNPPSAQDLQQAKDIAAHLAAWTIHR